MLCDDTCVILRLCVMFSVLIKQQSFFVILPYYTKLKSDRLVPGLEPRFASEKCRVQIVQRKTGFSGMSGRFSPLTAPLPFRDLPLRVPLVLFRLPLCSAHLNFCLAPLRFPLRSGSALMLCSCVRMSVSICHECITRTIGTIILTVAT